MGQSKDMIDSNLNHGIIASVFQMFRNVGNNRDLLWNLIARDFKNTYHGHFLGYVWSLLEPLVLTGIFYVILIILRNDPDNLVPLKIMIGILVYNAFSKTLASSTVSFSRNSSLIQQIYFPRELIITSIAGFQGVRLFLSLFIIVPYMVYVSINPSLYLLLLPIASFFAILLAKGIGMILVILHVRFRDLEQIVTLMLRAGFYLSGVFFSADIIPSEYLDLYFYNPVAVFIEMARGAVLGQYTVLDFEHIRNAIIISTLIYFIGVITFKKYEKGAVLYL